MPIQVAGCLAAYVTHVGDDHVTKMYLSYPKREAAQTHGYRLAKGAVTVKMQSGASHSYALIDCAGTP